MLKKISEMSKQELIAHMKASGEWHRADRESKAWARAFKLYQENQGVVVDMECSKCWSKVTDWMKA